LDVAVGDRLLLCSDGLSDAVAADGIAAILAAEGRPQDAAAALVTAAAAATDNVTAVVADLRSSTGPIPYVQTAGALASLHPSPAEGPGRTTTPPPTRPVPRGWESRTSW